MPRKGPIIVLACAFGMMTPPSVGGEGARAAALTPAPTAQTMDISGLADFATAAGSAGSARHDGELHDKGLAGFDTAAGAPGSDGDDGPGRSVGAKYNPEFIRRIQKALADQGFYLGPIDGLFGPRTEAAIRAYQDSADLPVDGLPSEQLVIDIETGGKVGELLNRLEKSRAKATEQAREALLSRPETRALIEGGAARTAKGHDVDACMAAPEPRCLLWEASENARDIEKPEMRDWALGEILTAQAKAGLAEDALLTTRRIHDPRLIMVALRDIAKAQAQAGQTEDAMAAVDVIPDTTQQVEAYIAIAEIQAQRGQVELASETAHHLIDYLKRITDPLAQLTLRTRIAVILFEAGEAEHAAENIRAAEDLMQYIKDDEERAEGQRYIAAAYAENGFPAKAMELLKDVQAGAHDVPVLIAAATKQAQSGADSEALVTAENIEAVRYRALVLARIASYQAGAGNLDKARTTLDKALEAAKTIRFPFAKAYAFSRIALALDDVGISAGNDIQLLDEALDTAHLIKDDRLRAHIFWTIADARLRAQDGEGAKRAQAEADKATADIMSPFSRVWMLCDIAEERARRGELDAAWAVFADAMDEAKTITHPWGRARALGKVAGTMTTLAFEGAETASR